MTRCFGRKVGGDERGDIVAITGGPAIPWKSYTATVNGGGVSQYDGQ